ncbi:hypothetical protein AZ66_29475 [Paenibacillus sp. E194]|uniref:hypothetical protein n=1 Tax=Paenibacillus sp. E194 TaxID=1458845 RepID=UPI0005C965A8|nr:hypothetical protein [Paenibacillus sp. E194]KJB84691.1 hypothetical protein AZ66_29475 [Paenibacillus sp. E194]
MRRPWNVIGVVMLAGIITGVLLVGLSMNAVDASRFYPGIDPVEKKIPIYEDVYGKPIIEEVYEP